MWKWLDALFSPIEEARCSFCLKKKSAVGTLVEGPGKAFICESCANFSSEIFEAERQRQVTNSDLK